MDFLVLVLLLSSHLFVLLLHLWPNLLRVFYPMPLGGRIASASPWEATMSFWWCCLTNYGLWRVMMGGPRVRCLTKLTLTRRGSPLRLWWGRGTGRTCWKCVWWRVFWGIQKGEFYDWGGEVVKGEWRGNVWLYVMVGIGLAYFLFWRFWMKHGQEDQLMK